MLLQTSRCPPASTRKPPAARSQASAAGTKSGRNLFKRQLTQRELALEQEHRRLDLFEYLVSFNAEQAAKRDDGDVAPSRIEESLQKAAESCPMASAIRARAHAIAQRSSLCAPKKSWRECEASLVIDSASVN